MKIKHFYYLIKYFGPSWVIFRSVYILQQKLGWFKYTIPSFRWEEKLFPSFIKKDYPHDIDEYFLYRKTKAPKFFFSPESMNAYRELLIKWDYGTTNTPQNLVENLIKGRFRFFGHLFLDVGYPPNWFKNPVVGDTIPSNKYWSEILDFAYSDIRVVWELNRFSFVFWLVRAYWRTGNEKYAKKFWELIEDWRLKNLPYYGPNWKCGQEISFRVMAWLFGLHGFLDSPFTTPKHVANLAQMIWASGIRIEKNIHYALSQKNNHGISEAVGLWTIGLLFPEFRESERWRKKGKMLLEKQGKEMIYEDGGFSQYSSNYHRVMLHDYIWALRLGELNEENFSSELVGRIKKAGEFLYQIQDDNGMVPVFGQNDGSLILPLNNCQYEDFRPLLQTVNVLTTKERIYNSGPWDEDLLWLFGPDALRSRAKNKLKKNIVLKEGGITVIRSKNNFGFIRCGKFKHRPSQADMLHVSIWWNGQKIAIDPGTFSYNFRSPWDNPFARSVYHNIVTVDEKDWMERVQKFLWLPWVGCNVKFFGKQGSKNLIYWEGQIASKINGDDIVYNRVVMLEENGSWIIVDRVLGHEVHRYRLSWLLNNFPYEIIEFNLIKFSLKGSEYFIRIFSSEHQEISLHKASPETPIAWYAPYYYSRKPALSLHSLVQDKSSLWVSVFSPFYSKIEESHNGLIVNTENQGKIAEIQLSLLNIKNSSSIRIVKTK